MRVIAAYFKNLNVTSAARENFNRTIIEGLYLVEDCKFTPKDPNLVGRIETFLIACEETIWAVGLEVEQEYCEIEEIMDDFRLDRRLIMSFLNGDLSEELFHSPIFANEL